MYAYTYLHTCIHTREDLGKIVASMIMRSCRPYFRPEGSEDWEGFYSGLDKANTLPQDSLNQACYDVT